MGKKPGNIFPKGHHKATLQRQGGTRVAQAKKTYAFPFGAYGSNGSEPLKGKDQSNGAGALNASNWKRFDAAGTGVFIPYRKGTPVLAVGDGVITKIGHIGDTKTYGKAYGNYNLVLQLDKPIKVDGKTYSHVYYGGCKQTTFWSSNNDPEVSAKSGTRVSKSERIAESGNLSGHGEGLVIGLSANKNGDPRSGNVTTVNNLYNAMNSFLSSVDVETGFIPNTAGGYNSPTDPALPSNDNSNPLDNPGSIATAAAFSSYFQMPGLMEQAEAIALTGKRSLMNDKPLLPFVEQIAAGSLRNFMSMPNGDFYAFYPDYFGGLGRTAYWQIKDIEIINGKIDLSDDSLATHVFVVGDTQASGGELGFGTIDWIDRINTAGVVNVLNAFAADFLNGPPSDATPDRTGIARPSLAKKDEAISFLKKYGARPYYEEAPAVRSPIYETFLAYQRFCLLWAAQFKTEFQFTFMPELFPGGLVEFPEHGLQCYVEQVVHAGSYESGFTTTATLSAPAAMKGDDGRPIDPDRSWVHAGMIRAFQFDPDNIAHPKDAYDTPAKPPKKGKGKK